MARLYTYGEGMKICSYTRIDKNGVFNHCKFFDVTESKYELPLGLNNERLLLIQKRGKRIGYDQDNVSFVLVPGVIVSSDGNNYNIEPVLDSDKRKIIRERVLDLGLEGFVNFWN